MKHQRVVTVSVLTLIGCATQSYQRPDGPVALSRGTIASFSALVPGSTATPRCVEPREAPVQPGGRAVALLYPGHLAQQVTVTLDGDGVPTKYLDVRGDLSTGHTAGDRTTIGLYLDQGYAVLSNRPESGEPVMLEVPLAEALSSDRLGNPTAMLQNVLAACAELSARALPPAR